MGVRVVAADAPLADEVRRTMRLVGTTPDSKVKPTPYDAALTSDAAPFDSVPGLGFNSDPNAAAILPPAGRVTGTGPILVIDPAQNNAYRALNRAWEQGAKVQASADASGSPVRYAIRGLSDAAQNDLVESLALRAERTLSAPGRAVRRPRLGLYQPWTGSMDEGWTRWLLEQYGFSYVLVHPDDFKSSLADKIDVLIIADDARVPIAGAAAGGRGGPSGGPRAVRPEYAYQLTPNDLQGFERFVRSGGTLVCLSNASAFAIQQFKLPVRNVVAGLRPEEFFLRGSIVEVTTDPSHPVMAGMTERAAVFVDGSPVFETTDGFQGSILARYADTGSPLLSGYLIGERHLQGNAAALDVQLGDGHVILLGFRPTWRGQPFGTFRVLFNAALFAR
jgi:hypothetical protein